MVKQQSKKNLTTAVKLILVVALFACLLPLPYGTFDLIRFAAFAGFIYLAYCYHKGHNEGKALLFAALALLMQPFFKLSLGRAAWNFIDIVIAVFIIYLIVKKK